MNDIYSRLAAVGTKIPDIILPAEGVDREKWAVIACDQFTQDRSYWEQVRQYAGESPSSLDLIFPEAYLDDPGRKERIERIHQTMKNWLHRGILAPPRTGLIYIERSTPWHSLRRGLILAVDLEQYDWAVSARTLIRTTEGTVPERLPPRMEIRREAALELPHILLLMDDEEDRLLPALGEAARKNLPLYDTPLMLGAGRITGWPLDKKTDWALLADGLETLAFRAGTRYGAVKPGEAPFLFAAGDGNHSLATAKAVWEEYKKAHAGEPGLENHPARWALAELENIYDPSISFEPIHRILFGAGMNETLAALDALPDFRSRPVSGQAELNALVAEPAAQANRYGLISAGSYVLGESSGAGIPAEELQPLLDRFLEASRKDLAIDYIHGEDALFKLMEQKDGPPKTGILLPPFKKSGLFETIAHSGPLPRKSFSMGEAREKRFYFECRRLFG